MIGHSLGEYVAACLSGVFSLEDALALVAERGRLMNQLPTGSMLSVPLAAKDLNPLLSGDLSLAVVNGPALSVVSGPTAAVDRLERMLAEKNIEGRRLRTSHAFHSQMVDPILTTFAEKVRKTGLRPPQIPYISNFTGTWITNDQATDPAYWAKHLRHTVHFSEGLHELMQERDRILLEVGPGQTLCSFARRQAHDIGESLILPSVSQHPGQRSEVANLLHTLGRLWLAGAPVDWTKYYAHERRRRLSLPTYPFDRQRYWIEAASTARHIPEVSQASALPPARHGMENWFYRPSWKQSMLPACKGFLGQAQKKLCWLLFVDSEGVGEQVAHRLEQQGEEVITVVPGDHFESLSERAYVVEAAQRSDYVALFEALQTAGKAPDRIVHMWMASFADPARSELDHCEDILGLGFYSLLYTMQAIGNLGRSAPVKLWIISSGIFDVTGHETLHPVKATVLGLCKTIPLEYSNVFCQCIDTDSPRRALQQEARLVDRLVEEFYAESAEPVVAIRGRHRWMQFLESIQIGPALHEHMRFREGGVYLITGGLGGIGFVLAEFLARTAHAKLVLLDRMAIPGREDWQPWVMTHGDEDDVSRKIRKMESLEDLGSEVLYVHADVTSMEQMKDAMARVHARFGNIHGVIHTAGLAGGGIIQLKSPETAGAVLAPKVKGTLILDEVLKGTPPELFVLFSSTYGIRSRLGQVDYSGANAFLDAFAHYKHSQNGKGTVSIDWDGWQEVGMAADAARVRQGIAVPPVPPSDPADHPLLDTCIMETGDKLAYRTHLSVGKHWLLDEHRLGGKAVLPGTAYLEMVRAIFERHYQSPIIEISDVYFISPLVVEEDEPKEVITFLNREGDHFDFCILSKSQSGSGEPAGWLEHARGKIRALELAAPDRRNVADIIARCGHALGSEEIAKQGERRHDLVYWGPRWQSLTQAWLGADEVIARVELPKQFVSDLQKWKLHPSILDVATSLAVRSADSDIYLPLSYERILIRNAFLPVLYCHATLKDFALARRETLTVDVMILDENGEIIAQVEKVTFKKMKADAAMAGLTRGSAASAARGAFGKILADLQKYQASVRGMPAVPEVLAGIKPAEGIEALQRILSMAAPQIVVSVGDIRISAEPGEAMIPAAPDEEKQEFAEIQGRHARPNVRSSYVAPQNSREQMLAGIWQEALGIEPVGIDDNFFELGGDSVIAIQIIAKANKSGFHLAANQIFENPTIREMMDAAEGPERQAQQAENIAAPGGQAQPAGASESAALRSPDFNWTQEELSKISSQLNKSRGDV
jgi:acyl transferase domain-containing protein